MHRTRLVLVAVFTFATTSGCSPFGEDSCEVTEAEFGQRNFLTCDVAGYRQSHLYTTDIYTAKCGRPSEEHWAFPEGFIRLSGPNSRYNDVLLTQSGEVCADLTFDKGGSRELCRSVTVLREDIWAKVEPDAPNPPGSRALVMSVGDHIYTGFGESNNWNRFDVATWTWEARSGVANLVDFSAPAGFSLGGAAYIVAKSAILYRYDEAGDTWQLVGDVKVGETLVDVAAMVAKDDTTVYGAAIGTTGYLGGGSGGALYAFDSVAGSWSEKTPRPGGRVEGAAVFVLDNKLHVGDQVYDPTTDTWSASGMTAQPFSGVGVVDSKAYFHTTAQLPTQMFDGASITEYAPRTQKLCSPGAMPNAGSTTATSGDFAFFADGAELFYYLPE